MTVALRRSWAKDLDAATLYELLKLRVEVFVVEQATPYPELAGRDLLAETPKWPTPRPFDTAARFSPPGPVLQLAPPATTSAEWSHMPIWK